MNITEELKRQLSNINKDTMTIAIDGFCGSGKTTFSTQLDQELHGNLVHIDHFYLPFASRKENWQEILGGNMDFFRLKTEVLDQIQQSSLQYGIFNPKQQQIVEQVTLTPKKYFILEGAYSHHPEIRPYFDYTIFFCCSLEKQQQRLMAREQQHFPAFQNIWMKREQDYFQAYQIKEKADIILDTTDWF